LLTLTAPSTLTAVRSPRSARRGPLAAVRSPRSARRWA